MKTTTNPNNLDWVRAQIWPCGDPTCRGCDHGGGSSQDCQEQDCHPHHDRARLVRDLPEGTFVRTGRFSGNVSRLTDQHSALEHAGGTEFIHADEVVIPVNGTWSVLHRPVPPRGRGTVWMVELGTMEGDTMTVETVETTSDLAARLAEVGLSEDHIRHLSKATAAESRVSANNRGQAVRVSIRATW